jgi:hydrogenase-4 component E
MNLDLVLVLVILTNLRLLASGRIGAAIRIVALQGVLVSLVPLLAPGHVSGWRVAGLAVGSAVLKAGVFPWLLFRALREVAIDREMRPFVGYVASSLLGVAGLAGAFLLSGRLPALPIEPAGLLVPTALFSILAGLFLLVARRRAVTQVLGFIVLENGVFLFGAGVMPETSLLVEAGVLLDLSVAVFIMGILLFHIRREFDHLDADRLSTLRDV